MACPRARRRPSVERHIAQQQQLVDGLPLESRVREAAVKMLTLRTAFGVSRLITRPFPAKS